VGALSLPRNDFGGKKARRGGAAASLAPILFRRGERRDRSIAIGSIVQLARGKLLPPGRSGAGHSGD